MSRGTIVITGASRGIGAATARMAAARGYAVCVNYHSNADLAARVVADIEAAGGRAIAQQAHVADEAAVIAMFDRAEAELGPLTALVNCAGLSGGRHAFADLDMANLAHVFSVNVFGAFLCAREAMRRMDPAGGGQGGGIVNLGSTAGTTGGFQLTAYAASKAALNTFTIGLAREAAPMGIRVNIVCPGIVDTDQPELQLDQPGKREAIERTIPLGRMGRPEEAAETILWLLSDESSYVAGANIVVSGAR
ncbi:SDR family NAD(P)-dependent oxidoreductase [Magnetospirillum sp. UT-4]|uniref:SDR family NAD(P)-dependent oxidoreductase n=1 Tax=Magnetospirillum sp. UT-4 TaxID=2681467 RepID=UPI00137C569F|nr:SDR family oxidoreductase [Magnetospirillum sp. UT-4]CAA7618438.1 Uncharacterized oxidoreductase YgfF [Magnetospirillum sp. UT-4]